MTEMQKTRYPGTIEVVVLTLLGLVSLCGLSGMVLALTVPHAETGRAIFELAPASLGLALAGLGSMALIWLRNRGRPASAWLAMSIVLWFIGVNILGWGGFAILSPGERAFAENLGLSFALCFAPGGFLTLLGLAFYGYDYRRSRQVETPVLAQATTAAEEERRWAGKLQRAAEYRAHIIDLIEQPQSSAFAGQLVPITAKLDQWEAYLHRLAGRLNDFEANRLLQRDIHDVPAAIARLQADLESESDPGLRAQMAETLAGYRQQQRQLEALAMLMRRTELEIDETLAEIGTIYSQLQLLGAKDLDSSRAGRLSAGIEEQVNRLGDLLSAMDDVYSHPAGEMGS